MTKRNLRKIPQTILDRIRTFDQDDVVVACAKLLRPEDIPRYSELGLSLVNGNLFLPSPAIPDPARGRYSRANVAGYEKVRRDLPMYPKEFATEAPNWKGSGTHTVYRSRMIYHRDFYPPKEVELSVMLIEEKGGGYVIKFAIEQVINRRTRNFEQELFYNLNLLQESIGSADVFPSAASLAEYMTTVRVDWQILPPGTVDEVLTQMLKGRRGVTPEQQDSMKARLSVMAKLNPEAYVAGSDEFLRYFGAKFGDDCVAFENIRYGNAVYLMYDSWQELSRRSRVELLSGPQEGFERIVHREGWESHFKSLIDVYRKRCAALQ